MKIITSATTTINDAITASGIAGTNIGSSGADTGGGGSGGSIWIQADTLVGNASATASGNAGGSNTNAGSNQYTGGGGAGGRIAIYYNASSYNSALITASGARTWCEVKERM